MWKQVVEDLRKRYVAARPDPKLEDAIEFAAFLKEARVLLFELQRLVRDIESDEAAYRNRFARLTTAGALRPARLKAAGRKNTMIDTVREFVRLNQDVEFKTEDVVEGCGFSTSQTESVRTFLRRLIDSDDIVRVKHGVYISNPRKNKRKPLSVVPED